METSLGTLQIGSLTIPLGRDWLALGRIEVEAALSRDVRREKIVGAHIPENRLDMVGVQTEAALSCKQEGGQPTHLVQLREESLLEVVGDGMSAGASAGAGGAG